MYVLPLHKKWIDGNNFNSGMMENWPLFNVLPSSTIIKSEADRKIARFGSEESELEFFFQSFLKSEIIFTLPV